MILTSKQRAYLRGLANGIDPIVIVGKEGIGDALVRQCAQALEARELIKGRVLENQLAHDARSAAETLATATGSAVVQVIGKCFVLYRPSRTRPVDKRIRLGDLRPGRKGAQR